MAIKIGDAVTLYSQNANDIIEVVVIKTRSGQMNQCNAVAEWKSDLAYISAYQEECQRAVWIEKFKRNYKY